MGADLSMYLDTPDALLQQQMPGVDIEAFKAAVRKSQSEGTDANAKPVTQTVKTDPTTGEQTMTISGSPQDLSPSNPLTPTVSAPVVPQQTAPQAAPAPVQPVAPDQTFNRMVQAESNGQQFNPQGGVLTSPKGAQGMAQIMPATAANPGYGVAPATPEEIATPEGNKAFGQRYYQGLLNHFGGDEQKAIAAYNAGPGRVQQNLQANNGQLNVSQLPQETQGYLNQVQGQGPVAPNQVSPMIAGSASSDVGLTPTEQAIAQMNGGKKPNEAEINTYYGKQIVDNLGNPVKMAQIYQDPNAPAFAKQASMRQMADIMGFQKGTADAQRDVSQMTPDAIANALKSKSEEGSYVKAVLYAQLGLKDLAAEEQQKLGAGRYFEMQTIGSGPNAEPVLIQKDKNGMPIYGITNSGQQLTTKELAVYAAPKGVEQSSEIYKNPYDKNGPAFYYERRPGQTAVFKEVGTGRVATPEEAKLLNKIGVAGTLEQQGTAAYNKGAYGAAGRGAGEGLTPTTIAAQPGIQGQGAPTVSGPAIPGQPGTQPVVRQPAPTTAPTTTAPVVNNPSIPNPFNQTATTTAPGGGIAQQKENIKTQGQRTESFNKIIDTEYREGAQKGEVISNNRKQQFDILNRVDPATGKGMAETISGLYNAANEHPGEQKWSIVRDIMAGKALPDNDASNRIAQLNLSPDAKSALQQFNSLNAQIASQTLRETAGPGSVSDAEQAANRARNVDLTKAPMLGAYNMMGQSQFTGDLHRYKADLAAGTNAPNATAFDRDFRKTQAELIKSYREVTEARLSYIDKNGGASNPNAIRQAYKLYPVPEYDPGTGEWKYTKPLSKILK